MARTSEAARSNPAGCSKSSDFSPTRPRRVSARRSRAGEKSDFFSILLNRLRSFVVIIGWEAESFRLALGDFFVHFIEPTARAAKDLPD